MKYKNFFTALFPSLVDADGYYQMQKEMNFKAVENTMFNVFAGKETFRAIVLPESIDTTSNSIAFNREKSLRVRPLDLHDFIIPEPCAGRSIQEIRKIIAMHPIAYPDNTIPKGGDNETADSGIMSGQIVECYFESGPDSGGSMRGLRYRLTKQVATSLIDLSCIGGVDLNSLFAGGGYGKHSTKDLFDNQDYSDVQLGDAFKGATQDILSFGAPIPCGEIIAFGGRKENKILDILAKNPEPSVKTDEQFWTTVLNKLDAQPTENKIRLFQAWAAHEAPSKLGPTNNPFATMYPGSSRAESVKFDPHITAFNWNTKNIRKYPQGYPWVKNFSTLEIGATATAATINKKQFYEPIIKKLLEPNPQFPDAWFDSPEVIQSFCYWGGCSQGGDGHGYAPAVKRNYKKRVKPKFHINTNKLSGRAAACLKKP